MITMHSLPYEVLDRVVHILETTTRYLATTSTENRQGTSYFPKD